MKRYKSIYEGIAIDIFLPKNNEVLNVALYLYGFPGSIGANPITKFLVEKNYVVLQPHYPGTFDSEGEHTPISSIDFLIKIQNIIESGFITELKDSKNIKIPTKIKTIVGSSFGAFVAIRASKYFFEIENLILFSPVISFSETENKTYGFYENAKENIEYTIRSRPYTYRIKDEMEWYKLYSGDFDEFTSKNNVKNIILIVGSKDPCFNLIIFEKNSPKILQKYFQNKPYIEIIEIENGKHNIESLFIDTLKNELFKKI